MDGYRNKVLLVVVVLAVAWIVAVAGCTPRAEEPKEGEILLRVHVLTDRPEMSEYELREGTPESVGVYEFYFKEPKLPGSGAFTELNSISLDKLNDTEFYGTKTVNKIDGILCVGYPPVNFIDGRACVQIDQSQNKLDVTVHYWKTGLGIIGGKGK